MPSTQDEWAIPYLGPRDAPSLESWTPRLAARLAAMYGRVQASIAAARSEALGAAAIAQARADDAFLRSSARIYVSSSDTIEVGSGPAWRPVEMSTQYASDGMRRSKTTTPGAGSQIRFNRSGAWLCMGRPVWKAPQAGTTPQGVRESVIGYAAGGSGTGTLQKAITANQRGDVATQGTNAYSLPIMSTIIPGSTGDVIELFARQTQGSNVELDGGDGLSGTFLAAVWLGPVTIP